MVRPPTARRRRRTALSTSGSSGIDVHQFSVVRLTRGLCRTQVAPVPSPTQSAAVRRRHANDARSPAVQRTLAVVLILNALVAVIKIVIGLRTGALTVLGAALESGLDMLNNI